MRYPWVAMIFAVGMLSGCSMRPAEITVAAPLAPPMGWNSWNSGMELDEQSVRDTIDAMVSSGMRDVGYRYVNLDAGWAAATRGSDGELVADPDRFPNGLAPLARYAHDRGLLFGLYASPFNQTCGQDPRTGSRGHEEQDAASFAAWGVDYLKYDWCRADDDHDEQVRVFTAMGKALRANGRRIIYSINPNSSDDPTAGTRYDWSGIADVVRTSGDLVPVWHNVLPPQGPGDPFATGAFHGVPGQFREAVAGAHPEMYRRDPDMLVVGVSWRDFFLNHRELLRRSVESGTVNPELLAQLEPMLAMSTETAEQIATEQPGLTEDEQRSHFSLWAMLGAPLMAGNDLRSMTATTRSILTNREVIDVDQDPLLAPPRPVRDLRVWARPMADGSVTIALFNTSESTADLRTTATEVGLPDAPCYAVRDLWAYTTHTTSGAIEARSLAPHAVRLLRLTAHCQA